MALAQALELVAMLYTVDMAMPQENGESHSTLLLDWMLFSPTELKYMPPLIPMAIFSTQ